MMRLQESTQNTNTLKFVLLSSYWNSERELGIKCLINSGINDYINFHHIAFSFINTKWIRIAYYTKWMTLYNSIIIIQQCTPSKWWKIVNGDARSVNSTISKTWLPVKYASLPKRKNWRISYPSNNREITRKNPESSVQIKNAATITLYPLKFAPGATDHSSDSNRWWMRRM